VLGVRTPQTLTICAYAKILRSTSRVFWDMSARDKFELHVNFDNSKSSLLDKVSQSS